MGPLTIDQLGREFNSYRSNRFYINGIFPTAVSSACNFDTNKINFYVKAAQVPSAAVGYVPLNYRGRNVKFPSERGFADWGVQVYPSSEKDTDLRNAFATWIELIDGAQTHDMNYNLVASRWEIHFNDLSYKKQNKTYRNVVTMFNCFPLEISTMEMDNNTPNTFAEFTLTMAYDYALEEKFS